MQFEGTPFKKRWFDGHSRLKRVSWACCIRALSDLSGCLSNPKGPSRPQRKDIGTPFKDQVYTTPVHGPFGEGGGNGTDAGNLGTSRAG